MAKREKLPLKEDCGDPAHKPGHENHIFVSLDHVPPLNQKDLADLEAAIAEKYEEIRKRHKGPRPLSPPWVRIFD